MRTKEQIAQHKKEYRKSAKARAYDKEYRKKYYTLHKDKFKVIRNSHFRSLKGKYQVLKSCSKRLKKQSVTFDISFTQYKLLIGTNTCSYCLEELNPTGSSLDRMDTNRGYCLNNVVPCCKTCNEIKGDSLTYEEMCVAMNSVLQLRDFKRSGGVWR